MIEFSLVSAKSNHFISKGFKDGIYAAPAEGKVRGMFVKGMKRPFRLFP
jgi:hypothetical protein